MLEVGDHVPPFALEATNGRRLEKQSLDGAPYLIYFYPKADTPGCTTQACDLEQALSDLKRAKLTVVGVSPDPVPKLDKFAAKYGLTFWLVSDAAHELAEQFGTWVEKKNYGRTYLGMERSSFLVDENGVIRASWRNVKPKEHLALVEAALAKL